MDSLKERLGKELVIGSWITLGHYSIAEIMCRAGFDWLAVDMEHSAITLPEAQKLIQTIEAGGLAPLVRVEENSPVAIKRVMDAGAHGVIVPMVNTKEDAAKAVASVRYPPAGTRGVGLARAQKYGLGFEAYREWASKESIVIVQIEHINAVNNLEGILSMEGVDGYIVGPYDLSASLGQPGNFTHPPFLDALKRIGSVAGKIGSQAAPIARGFHVVPPDPQECLKKAREGYTFIGYSLDTLILGRKCLDDVKLIRDGTGQPGLRPAGGREE